MSATVADACVVTNSSSIAFGVPSTAASQKVEKKGTISIACTRAAVAKVGIDSRGIPGTERLGSLAVTAGSGDFAAHGTRSDSGHSPVIGSGRSPLEQPAAPSLPPVSFTLFGTVLCNVELNCAQTGQSCDVRSRCKTSTPRSCPAHNCASGFEPVAVEPEQNACNDALLPYEIDAADPGVSTAASATAVRDGAIYHQTEGLYVSVDF
ncbi:MAG: spore coat protein U domain-containing protein [Candidatus Binataceae bacterium]